MAIESILRPKSAGQSLSAAESEAPGPIASIIYQ